MKSLVNFALFKEQLKRLWAVSALTVLAYVLFVVSPLWSAVSSNRDAMYAAESVIRIITMSNPIIEIVSVVAPFAAAVTSFSYLFQPKSTTAMHSYPLTKKQLFITNVAAGLVLIAIPLVIMCMLLLKPVVWQLPEARIDSFGMMYFERYVPELPFEIFPNGLADGAVINTLPVILGFFLRALLTNVYYYVLFLLAVSVAGNAIVAFLLSAVLPFIPCGFALLGYLTGNFYFFGFEPLDFGKTLTRVLAYTNPVALASTFHMQNIQRPYTTPVTSQQLTHIGVYMLIGAALFAVSYWCYHVRKQERAGDSVVFVPLRNVLIFLLSMAGMIFLGSFFVGVLKSVTAMYAGFAIGFTITYFIAQMISEKTFNVLYKAKDLIKYGGVMAALLLAVIVTARFDLFGYQTYQPQAEEIYGVYLHQPYVITNNYYGSEQSAEEKWSYFITDGRIIADTLTVHKRITDERHSLRSAFVRYMEGKANENEDNPITGQTFTILLKNGKYFSRKYALPADFARSSGLTSLLMEEDVILSQYGMFKNPEGIDALTLEYSYYYEEENGDGVVYEKTSYQSAYAEPVRIEEQSEIVSVLEEIKKDIVNTERERMNAGKDYDVSGGDCISGYAEIMRTQGYMYNNHFSLYSFENTDKWLESRSLKPERAR